MLRLKGFVETDTYVFERNVNVFESQEVLNHEVSLAEVFYQIGITKYYTDSLASSYKYFQKSIDRKYEVGKCLLWQGLIWTRTDSVQKSCKFFQRAKDLGEADADRYLNLYCQKK